MKKETTSDDMSENVKKDASARLMPQYLDTEVPDIEMFRPEAFEAATKKRNKLIIVPWRVSTDSNPQVKKGQLWYERKFGVHYGLGDDGRKSVLCPSVTFGKHCPICDAYRKLTRNPNSEVDQEVVDGLRPKQRQLFNVINLYGDRHKVLLWDISFHLFGKMLKQEINEGEDDYAAFANPSGGKILLVRFSKKTLGGNTFLEATKIDFKDRPYDLTTKTLSKAFDLDTILLEPSEEELEELASALPTMEEAPKKSKKSKKVKDKDDDEEDEDDLDHSSDDDEEDDEQEGEPAEDDDEEEDEEEGDEDEEEEEEEEPVRRKKGSTKAKAKAKKKSDDDDEEEDDLPF